MSDDAHRDDELTHAERRLVGLLALLRAQPAPPSDPHLARAVMRSVRWQALARGALEAIGTVGATVGEGLALLVRGGAGRRR